MTSERLDEMIRFFEGKLEETKKDKSEELDMCKKTTIDAWAIQAVLWELNKEKREKEEKQ